MAEPAAPARKVAVVACMDARLMPVRVLGFDVGDAHVIRNAGGIVTDDTLRSLAISQRVLSTRAVIVVHHTGCGMLGFDDDAFRSALHDETGLAPGWRPENGPADVADGVRESVARVQRCPFLPHRDSVRGFVYDVDSGELTEVECGSS